jgi:hypothetical protein
VVTYGIYGPPQPFIDKRPDPKVPELHLEFAENVIDAQSARWFVSESRKFLELKDYPPLLPRLFTLTDERNVYSRSTGTFLSGSSKDTMPINPLADLAGWNELWGNKNPTSLEGDPRFVGGDLRNKGREGKLVPSDFRLADGSPGKGRGQDGKDLGADVDRVGPSKPYEEWRKTPEYGEWQERMRAVLDGK